MHFFPDLGRTISAFRFWSKWRTSNICIDLIPISDVTDDRPFSREDTEGLKSAATSRSLGKRGCGDTVNHG